MQSMWKAIRKRKRARRRKTRFGKVIVVPESGPPCPRCKHATEVREHGAITAKHLAQPFYYARWYRCTNGQCKTTLIMPEEFKVWNYKRGSDVALDVLDELGADAR